MAFWKFENFLTDRNDGTVLRENDPERYNFNSSQERLHHKSDIGERLWLASYRNFDGRPTGLILGVLVVATKEFNEPGYIYGQLRIVGDPRLSRYFDPDDQDSTSTLMGLNFDSNKPISSPERIG